MTSLILVNGCATLVASIFDTGTSLGRPSDMTTTYSEVSENDNALAIVRDWQLAYRGNLPTVLCDQRRASQGTVDTVYAGRVSAKCIDCGKAMDYYVESAEQKVWKLEPVDSKGTHLDS